MDFIETVTLTGARQYILAAVHHAGRRVRILDATAHPTHAWVTQAVQNLLMDLKDVGSLARVRFSSVIVTASSPVQTSGTLDSGRVGLLRTRSRP